MEKIRVSKGKVILNFNPKFYDKGSIEMSAREFKDICSVDKTEEGFVLSPLTEIEPEKLGYEFYNYVLGVIKNG